MRKKICLILILILVMVGCENKPSRRDKFVEYKEDIYLPKKWAWQEKRGYYGDYYSDLEDIILMTVILKENKTEKEILERIHTSYNYYNVKLFSLTDKWEKMDITINGEKGYRIKTGNKLYPEIYGRFINDRGKNKFISVSAKNGEKMEELIKLVFRK